MSQMTNSFKMVVSEKVAGKYQARGSVAVYYPTLQEVGVVGAVVKTSDEEGFPVYENDLHNYLFSSLLAAIKAAARNKLEVVNSVVQLREGCVIATTTEQLLEAGGTSGAALQAIRDFLAAAKVFLATTGKSEKIQAQVLGLFKQPDTISLIEDAAKRERVRSYLISFVATITEDQEASWGRRIAQIDEACNAVSALDDAEF